MTGVFDVDLVPQVASIVELGAHLPPGWREHLTTAGGGLAAAPGRGYSFPAAPYRNSVLDPDDPVARAKELLDARGVTQAIINPGHAPNLGGISNEVMAAELATATNEWLLADWAGADDRVRVAMVVSARAGRLAAAEVDRRAGDERIAQILLAFPPVLMGDRSLYPLYEAAVAAGLPICLQAGGGFAGANRGPTPVGYPTTLWEYRIASAYGAVAHLTSLIAEGVFARFPALKVVFSGFGIAWLPSLLWRMDADYREPGSEGLPKRLDGLPSDTVREHVRFTTVGLERPAEPAALRALLASVGAEHMLLFASGDSSEKRPWPLHELGSAVACDNAAVFYGGAG
jgi:predicted TIM-barrel fold metal-dependent hydrolase